MYIRCLDGLRAFAILLVLFSHMGYSETPQWFRTISEYFNAGTIGVRLFFLISGFLITTILNNELQEKGSINLKRFFIRRILRIFPAFYSYLIVLGLLSHWNIIAIDTFVLFFSFFYLQNLNVFATSWLVKHSWSLSVEEQFYIFFPFLFKKIKNILQHHHFKMMILMTLVCSFFRVLSYLFPDISRLTGGMFFMHCDFLFYGSVLALFIGNFGEYLKEKLFPFRYWILVSALIILIYSSRLEYHSAFNILIFGNLILFSNLYILLFFLLFPQSPIGNVLESDAVRAIGKLSYSLYIWQQLFLGSADLWIKYKFLTVFPYNILLVFVCAACSYFFIEKPFLSLKKNYA